MSHPLISIITVTFNAADTLAPTMASIKAQSFHDFEHIIIDGNSSDATLEIAQQMATPNMRIHRESDAGLYDAMNKGLRLAKGEYVLFLNAGDSFHSADTLQKYADVCSDDVDIIYADTIVVDSNRKIVGKRHKSVPGVLTPESWLDGMLICHQAFMARKNIASPYSLQWRFSSDYDWTLQCIEATSPERCVNLNTVAIDYLNEGQTTANHRKSLIERFHIMRQHFGFFPTIKSHIRFLLGNSSAHQSASVL